MFEKKTNNYGWTTKLKKLDPSVLSFFYYLKGFPKWGSLLSKCIYLSLALSLSLILSQTTILAETFFELRFVFSFFKFFFHNILLKTLQSKL